jgi:hypothetical protein
LFEVVFAAAKKKKKKKKKTRYATLENLKTFNVKLLSVEIIHSADESFDFSSCTYININLISLIIFVYIIRNVRYRCPRKKNLHWYIYLRTMKTHARTICILLHENKTLTTPLDIDHNFNTKRKLHNWKWFKMFKIKCTPVNRRALGENHKITLFVTVMQT